MNTIHSLEAEIEELERKYWSCYNDYECEEDLEKRLYNIERLKFLVANTTINTTLKKGRKSGSPANVVFV